MLNQSDIFSTTSTPLPSIPYRAIQFIRSRLCNPNSYVSTAFIGTITRDLLSCLLNQVLRVTANCWTQISEQTPTIMNWSTHGFSDSQFRNSGSKNPLVEFLGISRTLLEPSAHPPPRPRMNRPDNDRIGIELRDAWVWVSVNAMMGIPFARHSFISLEISGIIPSAYSLFSAPSRTKPLIMSTTTSAVFSGLSSELFRGDKLHSWSCI